MFTRLLLGKKMLIKKGVMTMLLQPVKTKVMGLPNFQLWKCRQDLGSLRMLESCALREGLIIF